MRFEIEQVDDTTTRIVLYGRMDATGCELIETPFTAAASADRRHVVLDMRRVAFVGSLGIRLLVSSARVLTRRGRQLVLYGVQPQPLDVFETVGLGDLIPIASDEAEAMGLLAEAGR